MRAKVPLSELNARDVKGFVAVCGPLFERSPWIAERTWPRRPFASLALLHRELVATLDRAAEKEKLDLVAAHPDLVGALVRGARLSRESETEQAAAGLTLLGSDEIALFEKKNAAYRARFGFPFIICARENRAEAILAALPLRLANTRDEELTAALAEIAKIARLRLLDAVSEE